MRIVENLQQADRSMREEPPHGCCPEAGLGRGW